MTWTIIGTLGGLGVTLFTLQTLWIAHLLGALRREIRDMRSDIGCRIDNVDRSESRVVPDYDEHMARLEERSP